MTSSVTVLAPAYNEEAVIVPFVDAALAAMDPSWTLLVVDDGSGDATPQLLTDLTAAHDRLQVITHGENRGLGAALATGFAAAESDVVVTMDADLSHPFELLDALVTGCDDAAAVFASRFVPGGSMEDVPPLRRWISHVGNLVFRLLFWTRVRDLTTGYRAYRTEAVQDLDLVGSGFETQLEISVRLIDGGHRISEVPLRLVTRAFGESKMRYTRLIRAYGSMVLRMVALRWFGR